MGPDHSISTGHVEAPWTSLGGVILESLPPGTHELVVVVAGSILGYTYAGYPLVLAGLAWRAPRRDMMLPRRLLPRMGASVVVPMVDEETSLAALLASLADQSQRPDEVIVVVDGGTPDSVARLAPGRFPFPVRVLPLGRRAGKTAAQEEGVRNVMQRVVVFADVSARLGPGAIEALADRLRDPLVGVACGRLTYRGRGPEAGYWSFETAVKRLESRFHSLLGATGTLYAVRREDHQPLPDGVLSDLIGPLKLLLARGRPTVLVEDAHVSEDEPLRGMALLAIKARIYQRVLASWRHWAPAMDPARDPRLAFCFFSHKVLRWTTGILAPFFLASAFTCAARVIPVTQLTAMTLATLLFAMLVRGPRRLVAYALLLVLAQWLGALRWLTGRPSDTWRPTFSGQ